MRARVMPLDHEHAEPVLELTFVVAIVGIVLALALPSVGVMLDKMRTLDAVSLSTTHRADIAAHVPRFCRAAADSSAFGGAAR